jgi:DNA-binding response OmpR family regulator
VENFTSELDPILANHEPSPPGPELGEHGTILDQVRLLIVEDEPLIAQNLYEGLGANGFRPVMVHSTEAAWDVLWKRPFDLILLDVMLPEGDEAGFQLAQEMREANFRQPILFLTARETLPDRIRGLEFGDDYLAKPFALAEVAARLKALYRRGEMRARTVSWGEVELHSEAREVRRGGSLLRLSGKQYEVLELFMLNPGRVFSRDEVLERVWGAGFDANSNLVDVYVKYLRDKLGTGVIETVRGLGYRFSGE